MIKKTLITNLFWVLLFFTFFVFFEILFYKNRIITFKVIYGLLRSWWYREIRLSQFFWIYPVTIIVVLMSRYRPVTVPLLSHSFLGWAWLTVTVFTTVYERLWSSMTVYDRYNCFFTVCTRFISLLRDFQTKSAFN